MDNYYAYIIVTFLLLFILVIRQKMKMDIRRDFFELENSILKDKQIMQKRRARIKDMVCKHAR